MLTPLTGSSLASRCFSATGSVSPHLLTKVTFCPWACSRAAEMLSDAGQQSLLSCSYRAVLSVEGNHFPKSEKGLERTGDVGKGLLWKRNCRREFCAAAGSHWATLEAAHGFFSLNQEEKHAQTVLQNSESMEWDPESDVKPPLTLYFASLALNTPLLFSPGSRSWCPQGSHKSNFRTYSNFRCRGDENSLAAHSQRISRPKVRCFTGWLILFLNDYLPPEDL